MKPFYITAYALILLALTSCSATRSAIGKKNDGKLEVVFIQVNDVYEIAPLAGGKEGGMARVATLKKQYLQQNPNTFLVMAGDFVSPSIYNSLPYGGRRIRGQQMIETMNAAGMDMAIFGNHEFDINEQELQSRIDESAFQWIASNAFHKRGDSITAFSQRVPGAAPFPSYKILQLTDADGTTAKVGFMGLTLPFNQADYVSYTDPLATAKQLYQVLKDATDAVVAITHQSIDDDIKLADELPELALILGGHEHDMRLVKEGHVYITKAHANAKSAYVVKLLINKNTHTVQATPQLKLVDETLSLDSLTNSVVQKWNGIADANFDSLGFNARKVVMSQGELLDGREAAVRNGPTNLTQLITKAMAAAAPQAHVVLLNAGSIRVDDIIKMPVTEYDIIRCLPFGGGMKEVDMKGSLLLQILATGLKNKDTGGYLHHNENLLYDSTQQSWQLNHQLIDPNTIYRVALAEFLLTGKETNLDFLKPGNPAIVKIYDAPATTPNPLSDIRLAVVNYLIK